MTTTSTVLAQLLFRRGTGGEWGTANTVLANGEPGWSYDQQVLKVGDGHTPWADLKPLSLDPAVLAEIQQAAADAEAAADRAEAVGDTNDLITTGLVNDPTSQTTAALKSTYQTKIVFNVRDYGAKGDGTTNDSTVIRNAITAAAAAGGITYFSPGTYLVSEEGTTLGCLNLPSGARLAGPGKIIRHPSARDGVRPIQIDGKSDVRIDDLTIDMNGPGGVGAHCIQTKDSTHIFINKVKCLTGGRGGISIMGAAIHYRITECEIYSPIFNGITFYGSTAGGYPLAADDIAIEGCHIEAGVQPIDSEPVGGYAKNVRITNNYLASTDPDGNYAITMTAGYPDLNEKYVVTGNTCLGAITAFNCKDSIIANNTIDARGLSVNATPYAIHAGYASSGMTVTGNKIWTGPNGVGVGLFYAATAGVGRPVDWIVSGNEIHVQGTGATTAIGVWCSSAGPVVVSDNIVRGVNGGIGIWVRGTTAGQPAEAATITGNDVDGFARGIHSQYLADVIKALTITGNTVRQTTPTPTLTSGIELVGTSAQLPQVSISGNTVDSVYGANAYKLSNVLVREGSSPATWSGTGAPEGAVTGLVGSLYKRRDGGAATTLYVKESGTGNTGWVAVGAGGGGASAQVTARLTADVTRNNDATAFPIADLSLAVVANSKYRLTAYIVYSASTAADAGASWTIPAGASLTWTPNAAPITVSTAVTTVQRSGLAGGSLAQFGANGVGTKVVALPAGTLTTGANAGTFQFKFAQLVADPTDAVLYADTWITLDKVT